MKAILLIDIPDDYIGSVISVNLYGRNNRVIHEIHTNELRPLPDEIKVNPHKMSLHGIDYAIGWNDCLDEITGEKE